MGLAAARMQNCQNVQIIVWMANQSARMISPVVNALVKIINKVKAKINAMAVVLWRMLSAAVMESIAVLMDTLVKQMGNVPSKSKSEDSRGKQALADRKSVV